MELVTRFSVEDEVYDRILKENVTIIGFDLKHGRAGPTPDFFHCCIEYYVKNENYEGWRTEYELTRKTNTRSTIRPNSQDKAA